MDGSLVFAASPCYEQSPISAIVTHSRMSARMTSPKGMRMIAARPNVNKTSMRMTATRPNVNKTSTKLERRGRCFCMRGDEYDKLDTDMSPLILFLPPPCPTFKITVPKKHNVVLERFGNFWKVVNEGVHYILPYIDKVEGIYKSEFPIPDVDNYELGGIIKLDLLDNPTKDNKLTIATMIKTVLSNAMKENNTGDGLFKIEQVVDDKLNSILQEKLNEGLVEQNLSSMYKIEVNLDYFRSMTPAEAVVRVREKRKLINDKLEKHEEKEMKMKEAAEGMTPKVVTCVIAVVFALTAPNLLKQEVLNFITSALQVYTALSC